MRQIHTAERTVARLARLWSSGCSHAQQASRRLNDWNRYRLGRVLKWLFVLAVVAYVLGRSTTSLHQAFFRLPATIWSALPFLLQAVFIMVIAVGQFVAIFWFMSKGGVETYMPNDIKTRFTDIWEGQTSSACAGRTSSTSTHQRPSRRRAATSRPASSCGDLPAPQDVDRRGGGRRDGKPFVFVEPVPSTRVSSASASSSQVAVPQAAQARRPPRRRRRVLRRGRRARSRGALAQGGWNQGYMTPAEVGTWSSLTGCNGCTT